MEKVLQARIELANAGVPITLERAATTPTVIKLFQGDNVIRVAVPEARELLKHFLHLLSMDEQT